MKATLEYNLPEETQEFRDAVAGTEWRNAVWKMLHDEKSAIYLTNIKLAEALSSYLCDQNLDVEGE